MAKSGRPARKMDINSVIEIINDLHFNNAYLKKLSQGSYSSDVTKFSNFITEFRRRFTANMQSPFIYLTPPNELQERIEYANNNYEGDERKQMSMSTHIDPFHVHHNRSTLCAA